MIPLKKIAAVAAVGALVACNQSKESLDSPQTLKFSAIPDQNTTELAEKYGHLAKYLETTLGIPVEFVPSTSYEFSVDMFSTGDIQLAWFGGLSGVQARAKVPGSKAIAQGKADPVYYSYFIANASTGIEKSDEFPVALKDKTFTFGAESSTSGRLMPWYFITGATGEAPDKWFTKPFGFSGAHDKTALLVANGDFEAGVLSYKTYDKMVAEEKIDPEVCKVVWKTPPYADYNFSAHPVLEERYGAGFTQKLQDALVAIDDKQILDAFPREAIIPAKNEDFDGIVKVAKELGFLR